MNGEIEKLRDWIEGSKYIVFFGGAGVSTESGIPDFRSVDGLYSQKYDVPPEVILSHTFFERNPEVFYRFYRDKLVMDGVKPNQAHIRLAQMEAQGKLKAVITQNIDGLHQAAGSENVLELHGSLLRNHCTRCGRKYDLLFMRSNHGVPRCSCGGIVRPDVVLYEEPLDEKVLTRSMQYIACADMLIVGGTSLMVYPAAGLVDYYRGDKLVVINRDESARTRGANLFIGGSIGDVFAQV